MSGKRKVVYLIGAGASWNALPIVGELSHWLRAQPQWLASIEYKSPEVSSLIHQYGEELNNLATQSDLYGTIDTYARALYLRGEKESLFSLKMHLSMFFLLEQIGGRRSMASSVYLDSFKAKTSHIDTRYMSLLAQLIGDDSRISDNVSIISWNYDLQLENALALYGGLHSMESVHDDKRSWIFPALSDPSLAPPKNLPSVVHLNGVCGQGYLEGRFTCLYKNFLRTNSDEHFITSLFESYFEYDRRDQRFLRMHDEFFTFAWENKNVAKRAIDYARKFVSEASILVIIGYSFPEFNRIIDLDLIAKFCRSSDVNDKRIVIQNPSMDEFTFRHIFQISDHNPIGRRISILKNTSQFYLPPEIFNS